MSEGGVTEGAEETEKMPSPGWGRRKRLPEVTIPQGTNPKYLGECRDRREGTVHPVAQKQKRRSHLGNPK